MRISMGLSMASDDYGQNDYSHPTPYPARRLTHKSQRTEDPKARPSAKPASAHGGTRYALRRRDHGMLHSPRAESTTEKTPVVPSARSVHTKKKPLPALRGPPAVCNTGMAAARIPRRSVMMYPSRR